MATYVRMACGRWACRNATASSRAGASHTRLCPAPGTTTSASPAAARAAHVAKRIARAEHGRERRAIRGRAAREVHRDAVKLARGAPPADERVAERRAEVGRLQRGAKEGHVAAQASAQGSSEEGRLGRGAQGEHARHGRPLTDARREAASKGLADEGDGQRVSLAYAREQRVGRVDEGVGRPRRITRRALQARARSRRPCAGSHATHARAQGRPRAVRRGARGARGDRRRAGRPRRRWPSWAAPTRTRRRRACRTRRVRTRRGASCVCVC